MKVKNQIPEVLTEHYRYELPPERIALHPMKDRDQSRLLVAERSPLKIADRSFHELDRLLPEGSLLVLNDSRVLPARIPCRKASGGGAEVLLLEPLRPSPNPAMTLTRGSPSIWNAMVGGKRIQPGDRLDAPSGLRITVREKQGASAQVELSWSPEETPLAEILERVGVLPLPPYLKREVEGEDATRYQTVYARTSGSVAAPTAGLHFTDALRARLRDASVREMRVTLHVGAGTFKPVESTHAAGHEMHAERFEATREALEQLRESLIPRPGRPPVVAVGTTSLRTLESLYWLGARLVHEPGAEPDFLEQWEPYAETPGREVPAHEAIGALIGLLESRGLTKLVAQSRLMIVPGYVFKTADWLITNFHQPQSSLILLVAAWMGEEWREIYSHALNSGYRFLSYGDSSLLRRSRAGSLGLTEDG
jgi:S-adenosylmethionine:tRNA ribosyltransferase-isomerase